MSDYNSIYTGEQIDEGIGTALAVPDTYRTAAAQDAIDAAQDAKLEVLRPAASAQDVGKALIVKTVADGKATAYEFGEAGGGGDVADLEKALEPLMGSQVDVDWLSGYLNTGGAVGDVVDLTVNSNNNYKCAIFDVNAGDYYTLTLKGTNAARAWCVIDSDGEIVENAAAYSLLNAETVKIPNGGTRLLLNNHTATIEKPYVVKGDTAVNRINDLNYRLSALHPGAVVLTKKDDISWFNRRFTSTGTATSESRYIMRRGYVSSNIVAMVSPASNLRVGIFDIANSRIVGFWDENGETAVAFGKETSLNIVNFDKIRAKFPTYQLVLECDCAGDVAYPSANIDIYYIPYGTNTAEQFFTLPLNTIGWISKSNGTNWLSRDYLPDYVVRIKSNVILYLAFYDENDTYQGELGLKQLTNSGPWGANEVELDLMRRIFPQYKIKADIYLATSQLADIGEIVVDKKAYDLAQFEASHYKIPTLFSKTEFFTKTVEHDGTVSMQAFCTDGTYFYAAALKQKSTGSTTVLLKIDTTGELVAEADLGEIGHCNSWTFDPHTGKILTAGKDLTVIDPETLTVEGTRDVSDVIAKIGKRSVNDFPGFWAIYYCADYDVFFGINSGDTIAIINSDFTRVLKVLNVDRGTNANVEAQGILCVDGVIFVAFVKGSFDYGVYDFDGRLLKSFDNQRLTFERFTDNIRLSELEGACFLNGELYAWWNTSSANVGMITKTIPTGFEYVPVGAKQKKIEPLLMGDLTVTVTGTAPTITAEANTRYVCGEVTTLSFTPPASGVCDAIFTSGTTATVLTVPSTVKWANGFNPTSLDANTTYELNICDGLGVAVSWT